MVQYRSGYVDRWDYKADDLRWTDTGDSFDVVAVRKA